MHDSFTCGLTITAWRLADLTPTELWWRYIGLGGSRSPEALGAYLKDAIAWPATEHNVLAHALNERLWDLGVPSLAPYRHLVADPRHVDPAPRPDAASRARLARLARRQDRAGGRDDDPV